MNLLFDLSKENGGGSYVNACKYFISVPDIPEIEKYNCMSCLILPEF